MFFEVLVQVVVKVQLVFQEIVVLVCLVKCEIVGVVEYCFIYVDCIGEVVQVWCIKVDDIGQY